MNTKKLAYIFISIIVLTTVFGCKDTTVNEVDNRTIPDSNVSFRTHIAPIFNLKCNNCHGNGRTDAGLNLTNPSFFVDGRIVVPGEPDNSILVWTIEFKSGYPPMPPQTYATPLTVEQRRGVKTWIAEGAKNN